MTVVAEATRSRREAYYQKISDVGLAPLWESLHNLVPKQPASPAMPARWDFTNDIRPFLMEAGDIVTPEEAERRVLVLENPGLIGQSAITNSLYAGIQLVNPGETARSHRHSQSALRFVIEGQGGHTTVDGRCSAMYPGDFVITPSWHWHEHGNPTSEPMIWMDGLDVHIVKLFDTGFAETPTGDHGRYEQMTADTYAGFGHNLLPIGWVGADRNSPLLNYPYARSRETLDVLSRTSVADPAHGFKLRYVNPATGGFPMPTIAAFIQLLPGSMKTAPYRSTDGTVFSVVEGSGTSWIGGKSFDWKAKDIFVVPSWTTVSHKSDEDSVLFSFSDRAAQDALGLWREDRTPAPAGR